MIANIYTHYVHSKQYKWSRWYISAAELALAYANRSAVLFRLQRHDDCLADIRRALHGQYPKGTRMFIPKNSDEKGHTIGQKVILYK